MGVLPRKFYRRSTVVVAKALLGKRLVHIVRGKRVSGLIVEVEAYLGEKDAAAHTFGGRRTSRNEAMYGEGGHAYVYFIYGMHWCLNAVTRGHNQPEAVLIRALEPEEGIEAMKKRRKTDLKNLTNGPAKLCQALGVTRKLNGTDLVSSSKLFIEETPKKYSQRDIQKDRRIGVAYAGKAALWPLRFYIDQNPFVSKKKA